ncbi:MAG: hypothetical protein JO108_29315 [Acidobacteriaceae bacterium]|nr:hypothetical protein [Acidobacteriaceae bacterium]
MQANPLVLVPLIAGGLFIVLLAPILYKLLKAYRVEDVSPEWLESFSAQSYHAMQNLLAKDDFQFLSQQPGFDLSLYRKLRRERLHIFQQYLACIILDFNKLHVTARFLLAQSKEDHSELVSRLVWLKVKFSLSVVRAECNYLLCYLGYRSLAAQSVVQHLEQMSSQLRFISASASLA